MNKQEAIEKLQSKAVNHYSETSGWTKKIELDIAIDIINQLDEPVKPPEPEPWKPEKPVVPQFVADMIIKRKTAGQSVIKAIENLRFYEDACKWVRNNGETFVKAWLFGYEVEKEKLYTVEIPNPNGDGYSKTFLGKFKDDKVELCKWSGCTSIEFADNWKQEEYAQLTESEIKEDFAWAWQFAEEVEE